MNANDHARRIPVVLAVLCVLSSCGGKEAGAGSGASRGASAGETPVNHRSTDGACQTPPAAGTCSVTHVTKPQCTSDAQCTAGVNGRCQQGLQDCSCAYDECGGDADCAAGQTCVCHGSAYAGTSGSACVTGGCRIDSDCGSGGHCSPAPRAAVCNGLPQYYCHTPNDACVNDSDCTSLGPDGVCTSAGGKWYCEVQAHCL
jgi:hypothetical protein